jgi:subtilisin-like proprotein convertase family protein
MTYGRTQSSLKITAAADIKDVNVVLQVQHPDIAALEVS